MQKHTCWSRKGYTQGVMKSHLFCLCKFKIRVHSKDALDPQFPKEDSQSRREKAGRISAGPSQQVRQT